MDNQHKLISGYRDLSKGEIDLVNEIKAKGHELELIVDKVKDNGGDPRSANHALTQIQDGVMWLGRAVMRPE